MGEPRAVNAVSYVRRENGMTQQDPVIRPHGLSVLVPECERTYYIHFGSDAERDIWCDAIRANIELLRQAPGKIEEMISKVAILADTGRITRDKFGAIKLSLRNRFREKIDATRTDSFTKLLLAITARDFPMFSKLMTPDALRHRSSSGVSLLSHACLQGFREAVRLLLEAGANPNDMNVDGDTPLIIAGMLR